MQIILWIFASIGFIASVFIFMILFFSMTDNSKNPADMNEEEFQKWHERVRSMQS